MLDWYHNKKQKIFIEYSNHIKILDLEKLKPDENDETLELSEKLACDWIYAFNTEMKQVD